MADLRRATPRGQARRVGKWAVYSFADLTITSVLRVPDSQGFPDEEGTEMGIPQVKSPGNL